MWPIRNKTRIQMALIFPTLIIVGIVFSEASFADVELNAEVYTVTERYEGLAGMIEYQVPALKNVTVDLDNLSNREQLSHSWVVKENRIRLDSMHGTVPAEALLSKFARKWSGKTATPYRYANCDLSAIASIFRGWAHSNFHMTLELFNRVMQKGFIEIEAEEEWGDLLYLDKADHAFTYLGRDARNPEKKIVFTKNGLAPTHYLFMYLDDVLEGYRSQYSDRRAFRPVKHVSAPVMPFLWDKICSALPFCNSEDHGGSIPKNFRRSIQ